MSKTIQFGGAARIKEPSRYVSFDRGSLFDENIYGGGSIITFGDIPHFKEPCKYASGETLCEVSSEEREEVFALYKQVRRYFYLVELISKRERFVDHSK